MVDRQDTTTIRVTNEFKARLATHGQFGERFEDIIIRLLGDKFMNTATGDRDTKVYDKKDVDSKKLKKILSDPEAKKQAKALLRSQKTGGKDGIK